MGFQSVPKKLVNLNDLERHNSPYFALFHRNWLITRAITSQWLKP